MAGAALKDSVLVTSGGRVLGLTATADSLGEAIEHAYRLTEGVSFATKYMRTDIGKRAMQALEG